MSNTKPRRQRRVRARPPSTASSTHRRMDLPAPSRASGDVRGCCAMYTAASWCMSSWNSTRRWKYSVRWSCGVAQQRQAVAPSPASQVVAQRVGARAAAAPSAWLCATRPESNQLSPSRAPRRRAARRGRRPHRRARCGLRPSHHSWNQPMCPSSHSGGLSSGEYGTAQRPGRNAVLVGREGGERVCRARRARRVAERRVGAARGAGSAQAFEVIPVSVAA